MRSAETVLSIIRERGKKGLPLEDIYRQLYNPGLYLMAYGIKVNPVLTHFANFDLTHPNTHQCLQERSPPPSLLDAKRPFIR